MPFDAFLKVEGIDGDSKDQQHVGWIEIESYSWGLTQTGTLGGGGGGGAGKAVFQDVHFTSLTSKASPLLAKACATGQHIVKAQLSLVKSAASPFEFIKMEFDDVLVSSYQSGGTAGGEAAPTDQFSLDFGKIEFDYIPQKADGSADTPVVFTFDVQAQKT